MPINFRIGKKCWKTDGSSSTSFRRIFSIINQATIGCIIYYSLKIVVYKGYSKRRCKIKKAGRLSGLSEVFC